MVLTKQSYCCKYQKPNRNYTIDFKNMYECAKLLYTSFLTLRTHNVNSVEKNNQL